MLPRILLICSAFLNGMSTLFLMVVCTDAALWAKSRWLWPIALVLAPVAIVAFFVHSLFQALGSIPAFAAHNILGTRAKIETNGLSLAGRTLTKPRFIAWSDIALIRRVYERLFEEPQARFKDNQAYQIALNNGEIVFVDYVDESALKARSESLKIAIEGFDGRLLASNFENENSFKCEA